MNPIKRVLKPEYVWRPRQLWRRISFRRTAEFVPLPLAWNCTIVACPSESIGESIASLGVYDLPVTEAISRLTDVGDEAIDVGANIGYMSLALARAAGPLGRIHSFEPNPYVIPILRENVRNWKNYHFAPIWIEACAISDRDGYGTLHFPTGYRENQGNVSLAKTTQGNIQVRKLDSFKFGDVGIMKIDVEGHERNVLSGAWRLLSKKQIRDVLFEEHESYPADSHRLVLDAGYRLYRVAGSMWRPLLLSPDDQKRRGFLPTTYLGTIDEKRALDRFRKPGWRCLSAKLPQNAAAVG